MEKPKKEKAPTEDLNFEEFFGDFEIEYLPFVEWSITIDDNKSIEFNFESNEPIKYTNKWNREQWKINVYQDNDLRLLSGGKRLFSSILLFCKKNNKKPIDLGQVVIVRYGSGFDTKYVISKKIKQKKLKPKK